MSNSLEKMFLAFAFSAMIATPTQAAMFCVSTGDQLQSALDAASSNSQDDEIRIVVGTLTRAALLPTPERWRFDPVDEPFALTVSGGWSSGNTCATQTQNPQLTVLDGGWAGPVLDLIATDSNDAFMLIWRNMTLTRGLSDQHSDTYAAGITVRMGSNAAASITLEQLIVVAGSALVGNTHSGIKSNVSSGTFRLRNCIVAENTGIYASVAIQQFGTGVVYANNNSVFNNEATSPTLTSAGVALSGAINFANNVVAGNTRAGQSADMMLITSNSGIVFRNNHFGGQLIGELQPSINDQTSYGDPGWDIVGIIPGPLAGSPLINSGRNSALGGVGSLDVQGATRTQQGTVDRGAVETNLAVLVPDVFSNGFE